VLVDPFIIRVQIDSRRAKKSNRSNSKSFLNCGQHCQPAGLTKFRSVDVQGLCEGKNFFRLTALGLFATAINAILENYQKLFFFRFNYEF